MTDLDREPHHASSTDHLLTELKLHGYRPFEGEPDPRPLPDPQTASAALIDMFDALVSTFTDTRLEPDLDEVLWSLVNLFHRKVDREQRSLDDNEQEQRRSQKEQDGSEVRSGELERLIAEGISGIERRNSFEFLRDGSADLYSVHTGSAWKPRAGSQVNHKAMTASVIDSRNHINAKRRAETEVLLPEGPKIAFTGGQDCNDHVRIWAVLDRVLAKHPGLVLLHGGSPTGAERIAACWAHARTVTQITFKPDWARHNKAAPFKRNDIMLDVMPIGVVLFPGSGVTDNLADKAKVLGIPCFDFRKGGGA